MRPLLIVALALFGCGKSESGGEAAKSDPAAKTAPTANTEPGAPPDKTEPVTEPPPAAPTAKSTAEPGTVRLVIAFTDELLGSEARAIGEIEKALAKSKATVTKADASAEELAAAQAAWSGAKPAALPATWAESETVIVAEMLPPVGKKPKRTSGGLGGLVVFRPPSLEPIYMEKVNKAAGVFMSGEELGKWMESILALAGGSR